MPIHGPDEPVYTIGVMARLLGVSAQVLRIWEREQLICPYRTQTNNRLYSENDYYQLQRIRELTRQGVNLAGIRAMMANAGFNESARPAPAADTATVPVRARGGKVRGNQYGQSGRH